MPTHEENAEAHRLQTEARRLVKKAEREERKRQFLQNRLNERLNPTDNDPKKIRRMMAEMNVAHARETYLEALMVREELLNCGDPASAIKAMESTFAWAGSMDDLRSDDIKLSDLSPEEMLPAIMRLFEEKKISEATLIALVRIPGLSRAPFRHECAQCSDLIVRTIPM